MRFTFIRDHAGTWPIRLMCRVLQVSASGYYAWLLRAPDGSLASGRTVLAALEQRVQDLTANQPTLHAIREKALPFVREDGSAVVPARSWVAAAAP